MVMTQLVDHRPESAAAAAARSAYDLRRRRDMLFADFPGLFGDPAWDMLLDLYIAEIDARPVTVAQACAASAVAASTALRCLMLLIEQGLIERPDPPAVATNLIRLTDRGQDYMDQLFKD